MIEVVAFDADDTLWNNEVLYKRAEQRFADLMRSGGFGGEPLDVLAAVERRNVPVFGYGIKSFTLSMIEAAVEIGDGHCKPQWISEILDYAKQILTSEVELLPYVSSTLEELAAQYRLMLITKGELSEQERKIQASGLTSYFEQIEILGSKHEEAYQALLDKYDIVPQRFVMVGNSLRSDILPVVALGAFAVYVPFEHTWVYEHVSEDELAHAAYETVEHLGELPDVLLRLNRR